MIRISVVVSRGGASFRAVVCAESIERAVGIARARYPGSEVRVLFPIAPETFFAGYSGAAANQIQPEMPVVAAS